jgi:hypothetical protein
MSGSRAAATSADAATKPASPARNVRLRPMISPSLLPVISSSEKASVYADTVHCSPSSSDAAGRQGHRD